MTFPHSPVRDKCESGARCATYRYCFLKLAYITWLNTWKCMWFGFIPGPLLLTSGALVIYPNYTVCWCLYNCSPYKSHQELLPQECSKWSKENHAMREMALSSLHKTLKKMKSKPLPRWYILWRHRLEEKISPFWHHFSPCDIRDTISSKIRIVSECGKTGCVIIYPVTLRKEKDSSFMSLIYLISDLAKTWSISNCNDNPPFWCQNTRSPDQDYLSKLSYPELNTDAVLRRFRFREHGVRPLMLRAFLSL